MGKFLSSSRLSRNITNLFHYIYLAFVLAFGFIAIVATGGGDGGNEGEKDQQTPIVLGTWTWMSGSNTVNQPGIYGTKGVADPSNTPGARAESISWVDNPNCLWLFGGYQYRYPNSYYFNDLWKFEQ